MLKAISRVSFRRSRRQFNLGSYRKAACFQTISRTVGRKGIYRRPRPRTIFLVSIASAAESFRSTCGSLRRAPEYNKQRSPAATPQVGQGTARNSLGVRSLILIGIGDPEIFHGQLACQCPRIPERLVSPFDSVWGLRPERLRGKQQRWKNDRFVG
jgi:hypothetical protein